MAEKKVDRTAEWRKENLEIVCFALNIGSNDRDKAIATYLETKKNKGAYIKSLIAKDMLENKKED